MVLQFLSLLCILSKVILMIMCIFIHCSSYFISYFCSLFRPILENSWCFCSHFNVISSLLRIFTIISYILILIFSVSPFLNIRAVVTLTHSYFSKIIAISIKRIFNITRIALNVLFVIIILRCFR